MICIYMCFFFLFKGVHPEIPYNVSVWVLQKNTAGAARYAIAFTRQGGLFQTCTRQDI